MFVDWTCTFGQALHGRSYLGCHNNDVPPEHGFNHHPRTPLRLSHDVWMRLQGTLNAFSAGILLYNGVVDLLLPSFG